MKKAHSAPVNERMSVCLWSEINKINSKIIKYEIYIKNVQIESQLQLKVTAMCVKVANFNFCYKHFSLWHLNEQIQSLLVEFLLLLACLFVWTFLGSFSLFFLFYFFLFQAFGTMLNEFLLLSFECASSSSTLGNGIK